MQFVCAEISAIKILEGKGCTLGKNKVQKQLAIADSSTLKCKLSAITVRLRCNHSAATPRMQNSCFQNLNSRVNRRLAGRIGAIENICSVTLKRVKNLADFLGKAADTKNLLCRLDRKKNFVCKSFFGLKRGQNFGLPGRSLGCQKSWRK